MRLLDFSHGWNFAKKYWAFPVASGKRAAFTLIETVLAVSLTTIVLTAVCGLVLTTMQASRGNQALIQASYLAQEDLELARFVRDSNWLQNYQWNQGSTLWGQSLEVTAVNPERTLYLRRLSSSPFVELSVNAQDGVVKLGGTSFARSLKVTGYQEGSNFKTDQLQLTSTVTWTERGRERSVELSTLLTNWK